MPDATARAVNPDAVLESARRWGDALAVHDIRAGSPHQEILSGEWADSLTPRDLYAHLIGPDWDGGRPRWVDADTGLPFDTEFFLTEICDAFEGAYNGAGWPETENDHG